MKLYILAREEKLIKVNFDPDLTKMLKEVKYFYLLDRPVPETASTIYKFDAKFKT